MGRQVDQKTLPLRSFNPLITSNNNQFQPNRRQLLICYLERYLAPQVAHEKLVELARARNSNLVAPCNLPCAHLSRCPKRRLSPVGRAATVGPFAFVYQKRAANAEVKNTNTKHFGACKLHRRKEMKELSIKKSSLLNSSGESMA